MDEKQMNFILFYYKIYNLFVFHLSSHRSTARFAQGY